jgi:hypothetical protein
MGVCVLDGGSAGLWRQPRSTKCDGPTERGQELADTPRQLRRLRTTGAGEIIGVGRVLVPQMPMCELVEDPRDVGPIR